MQDALLTATKMTQSLLNPMNSPLAIAATLLWLVLLGLMLRYYRRWVKERSKEKVIYQNHPAIPVKVYQLSDIETEPTSDGKVKPVRQKPLPRSVASQPIVSSTNVWDV